jgi:hypothetical protein
MNSFWKRIGIVASAVVLVGGVAAVANATGSNDASRNFQYFACLQASTKSLLNVTINRRAECSKGEREISWNASGPSGKAGAAGTTWTTGTQTPTSIAGQQDGDLFFDDVSGEVFEDVSGAWVAEGNLRGPAGTSGTNGVVGTNGADGQDGTSVVTSASAPTGACTAGDTDIELDNGVVWSCVSASWVNTGSSIEGPQGAPGLTSLTALQGSACTYLGDPSTINVTQDPTTGVVSIVCTPLPIFEVSVSVTNGHISTLEIAVTTPAGQSGAVGSDNSSFLSAIAAAGTSGTITAVSGSEVTGGGTDFTYTCDGGSTQSGTMTSGSTSGLYYVGTCNYAALSTPFPMSVVLP